MPGYSDKTVAQRAVATYCLCGGRGFSSLWWMTFLFRARWILAAVMLAVMALPAAAAKSKGPKQRDIADTIAVNPILTKFAAMLQASGMDTFLSSKGPFTVFVPTDSAFAKLPPYAFDIMVQEQNKERLQAIVLYHVFNGKGMTARELTPGKSLNSCQGQALMFKTTKLGTQLVMKAKITHADIKCANGVIHQIDTLLNPPEGTLPPLAAPMLTSPQVAAPAVTPVPANGPGDAGSPPVVPVAPAGTGDVPVAPKATE